MTYTILQIIKALPLDIQVQDTIAQKYPTWPEEKQALFSRTAWKAFYEVRKHIENVLRNKMIEEIANGTRDANIDLENELAIAVENELQIRISGQHQDDDRLIALRKELEKYIKTM